MILIPTFAIIQKQSVKSVRSYMHPLKQLMSRHILIKS